MLCFDYINIKTKSKNKFYLTIQKHFYNVFYPIKTENNFSFNTDI